MYNSKSNRISYQKGDRPEFNIRFGSSNANNARTPESNHPFFILPQRKKILQLPTNTTNQNMDVQAPIDPANLFSARGLVVVITGGGSGVTQSQNHPTTPPPHFRPLSPLHSAMED